MADSSFKDCLVGLSKPMLLCVFGRACWKQQVISTYGTLSDDACALCLLFTSSTCVAGMRRTKTPRSRAAQEGKASSLARWVMGVRFSGYHSLVYSLKTTYQNVERCYQHNLALLPPPLPSKQAHILWAVFQQYAYQMRVSFCRPSAFRLTRLELIVSPFFYSYFRLLNLSHDWSRTTSLWSMNRLPSLWTPISTLHLPFTWTSYSLSFKYTFLTSTGVSLTCPPNNRQWRRFRPGSSFKNVC